MQPGGCGEGGVATRVGAGAAVGWISSAHQRGTWRMAERAAVALAALAAATSARGDNDGPFGPMELERAHRNDAAVGEVAVTVGEARPPGGVGDMGDWIRFGDRALVARLPVDLSGTRLGMHAHAAVSVTSMG